MRWNWRKRLRRFEGIKYTRGAAPLRAGMKMRLHAVDLGALVASWDQPDRRLISRTYRAATIAPGATDVPDLIETAPLRTAGGSALRGAATDPSPARVLIRIRQLRLGRSGHAGQNGRSAVNATVYLCMKFSFRDKSLNFTYYSRRRRGRLGLLATADHAKPLPAATALCFN
jgi:hypothetical protein